MLRFLELILELQLEQQLLHLSLYLLSLFPLFLIQSLIMQHLDLIQLLLF
jgi:hypothetical protein